MRLKEITGSLSDDIVKLIPSHCGVRVAILRGKATKFALWFLARHTGGDEMIEKHKIHFVCMALINKPRPVDPRSGRSIYARTLVVSRVRPSHEKKLKGFGQMRIDWANVQHATLVVHLNYSSHMTTWYAMNLFLGWYISSYCAIACTSIVSLHHAGTIHAKCARWLIEKSNMDIELAFNLEHLLTLTFTSRFLPSRMY